MIRQAFRNDREAICDLLQWSQRRYQRVREGLYSRWGWQNAHRGAKNISLFAAIGGTFVPDWPNLSICSLDDGGCPDRSRRRPDFRGAHAAPDIAGIMEPSGEADVCAGEFSRGRCSSRRARTDFSDAREKYDRRSRIYMRRCAALTTRRWLGSNFRMGELFETIPFKRFPSRHRVHRVISMK